MSDSNIPGYIRPDKYLQRTLTLVPWARWWLPWGERRWSSQWGYCSTSACNMAVHPFPCSKVSICPSEAGCCWQWMSSEKPKWELRPKTQCWHRAWVCRCPSETITQQVQPSQVFPDCCCFEGWIWKGHLNCPAFSGCKRLHKHRWMWAGVMFTNFQDSSIPVLPM